MIGSVNMKNLVVFFLLFLFCFVSLFLAFGVEDCDPFSIVRYLLVCTVSTFNQSADNDE